jgi:superfamily I DNA/RNA helicase
MEISEDKKRILNELEPGTAVLIEGEAGTGKTLMGILCGQKLLVYARPWQRCLYLTYSKLARRQIDNCLRKTTAEKMLDPNMAARMDILNYHSLWWQFITKYYSYLGIIREPMLCTADETNNLAFEVERELPRNIIPGPFLTRKGDLNKTKARSLSNVLGGTAAVYAQWGPENFGRHASDFINSDDFLSWSKDRIFSWNRQGLFSHAETVCWVHSLLRSHPNVLLWMREVYPIVVIDEFQDTDVAQWDIVQLLVPTTLIAMADAAQTIHIWRGADPKRIEQFVDFGKKNSNYRGHESRSLYHRHRASKQMSDHRNIDWRPLKEPANTDSAIQINLAKKLAKAECKKIAKEIRKSHKTVGILCLNNAMADDIVSFLRNRQYFSNGNGYEGGTPCARMGAENSPFDASRTIILRLLQLCEAESTESVQNFVANKILETALPCEINTCSVASRKCDLKDRWSGAGDVTFFLSKDFGSGLRKLAEFIIGQARSTNCFTDRQISGCLKQIGETISHIGIKIWTKYSLEDKRKRIDAAILRYENAIAVYDAIEPVSVMTIHQSKGREFYSVVVPWFTFVPWLPDEPSWDTSTLDHRNLFHTACTRATNNVIVIFPKDQRAYWPDT